MGLAGVSGNGQSELAQVLQGTRASTAGSITVADQDVTGADPDRIMKAGVGRIPEDRHASVVPEMTVAQNMALEHLAEFTRNGSLDRRQMHVHAEKLIAEYQIKARPDDRIRTLSGGNMQKVILARVMERNPKVIIVSQPTRGLDIGATEYVRSRLLEQRQRGAAILLISEDLDEILELSDRIAVIYEGEIQGILPRAEADPERLGLLMAGAKDFRVMGLKFERNPAPVWFRPLIPLLAIVLTFAITTTLVLLVNANPLQAYYYFLAEPLSSRVSIIEVLVKSTPLLLTGAAVTFAFVGGFWNIGAEGQLLAGATAATAIGLQMDGVPPLIALPLMIVGGFAAGSAWVLIPALMRVKLAIDEVVTTLLLNSVALLGVSALLNGPVARPGVTVAAVAGDRRGRDLPQADPPLPVAPWASFWQSSSSS